MSYKINQTPDDLLLNIGAILGNIPDDLLHDLIKFIERGDQKAVLQ